MGIEALTSSIVEGFTTQAPANTQENTEQPLENEFKDDDMSRRIAILAKKEKGIMDSHKSYQQKMKDLEEREGKLSKYSKYDDINDDTAIDFFKEKGLNFEKIQEKWLSQLNDDDIDPIQRQIKELTAKLQSKDSEIEKILEEKLSARDNSAKEKQIEEDSKYYNDELKKHLKANAEQYDLINTFEAEEEVFKVIKDVYLKTGKDGTPKLLTFDEASQIYETKLAELVKGMSKSKKVMSLLGNQEEESQDQMFGQKTIDDSYSQSSSTRPELKTEAERMKAAAKLFESMVRGEQV